jgi:hypothetical protein
MFGSETIEVVIGLVFIFFLISLLCTALTEWIARIFAMRAASLRKSILKLFGATYNAPKTTVDAAKSKMQDFVDHPLIQGITPGNNWFRKAVRSISLGTVGEPFPSSLPARTFALTVLDLIGPSDPKPLSGSLALQSRTILRRIEDNLPALPKGLAQTLTPMLNEAKSKATAWKDVATEFQSSIEKWFDDAMVRLSGQYKRKTQVIVLCLAAVLCFGWNVDTFAITRGLYHDANLRATVVAAAELQVQQPASDNAAQANVSKLISDVEGLQLPLGWNDHPFGPDKDHPMAGDWFYKVLGILATVVAVSLGSAFWFDLLNKLVNLRAAGKTPEKTEETPKPDSG